MLRPYFVAMIVLMAVATYTTRVGLIGVAKQVEIHPLLRRALDYVPVSILAALVFPAVLAPSGQMESPVTNVYVWGSVITVAVLLLTKRQWLAIVLGVASLMLMRVFIGG